VPQLDRARNDGNEADKSPSEQTKILVRGGLQERERETLPPKRAASAVFVLGAERERR
jgi:hypothetical protein